MRHIIAISGPPGSGKTSLLLGVGKHIVETANVFFDHYEQITQRPLDEVLDWARRGGDVNEFAIPRLAADLERLKAGIPVTDPTTHQTVMPARNILFEAPFGRAHRATGRFIDLLVWIDVPLDLALARNLRELRRRARAATPPAPAEEVLHWMDAYLDGYLRGVRDLLELQREQVAGEADLILDGRQTVDDLAHQLSQEVRQRHAASVQNR